MSGQTLFTFARMTPAEYRDDCEQKRLTFEGTPKRKDGAVNVIRLVDCPACGGSTFDDGVRPLVCHCGATVDDEGGGA